MVMTVDNFKKWRRKSRLCSHGLMGSLWLYLIGIIRSTTEHLDDVFWEQRNLSCKKKTKNNLSNTKTGYDMAAVQVDSKARITSIEQCVMFLN